MPAFAAIDLSRLPAPEIVETLSFEDIRAAMLADLAERDPEFTAGLLESDPAVKILEVCAERELILRQRVNDAARAVMIHFSARTDLDNMAGNANLLRQTVDPGDPDALPPVPPTFESDGRLRLRYLLAWKGLSGGGPEGAYLKHCLDASPLVRDAAIFSPDPCEIVIYLLSTEGDGTADEDLIEAVRAYLFDPAPDERSPLRVPHGDRVQIFSVDAIDYAIEIEIDVLSGPDAEVVRQAAEDAARAYADFAGIAGHETVIGMARTGSGFEAAAHVAGVWRAAVTITRDPEGTPEEVADMLPDEGEVAYAVAVTVTIAEA